MLTILAFVFVLSVLILVHELGHYFAAKSVDIKVERFSLGLGPKVAGFRRGETEYVVSALPLGGYVKMAGMEDMEALEGGAATANPAAAGRNFDDKSRWARVWVVSAGVLMNAVFAFLVYTAVALAYGERVNPSTRVAVPEDAELAGAAARLRDIPFGAELRSVGGRTVSDWPEVQRTLAVAPAGDVTLRFSDAEPVIIPLPRSDADRLALLEQLRPLRVPVIGSVAAGSPAARAGIRSGDLVLSVGGAPVRVWEELVEEVSARPDQTVTVVVERAGGRVQTLITPEPEVSVEGGERVGRIGVGEGYSVHRTYGVAGAVVRGSELTWVNSVMIVGFVVDLFTGKRSPRELGGPIVIAEFSGESARMGLEPFLLFMAILSINLAILNLLPIPVLDGGQLVFLLAEALRGRPMSLQQRIRLSNVGLVIVVGIMVWVVANDLLRYVFGV
ncbi:MAG: RIP metalloprotease RseP [Longimicrobiaceae bacterium]